MVALIAAVGALVPAFLEFEETGVDGLFSAWLSAYGASLYTLVGVAVLWRRPGHGIGRLSLIIGLAFTTSVLLTIVPGPRQLTDIGLALAMGLAFTGWIIGGSLLVVWFPDGHRTSRLGGLIELILVVTVIGLVLSSSRDDVAPTGVLVGLFDVADVLGFPGLLLVYLGAVADLGLRYRQADDVRRTQMRWVIAAEGLTLLTIIGFFALGTIFEWLFLVMFISIGLPVLAVAVAITRYHLYDIDRIVSRSIAYLLVTTVLVAVFASIVLLLQGLISGAVAAPGTELDPRVVAISTLVVAALFNPLRRRVQSAVDRRFNREHYDTARIVAGFSGRLRDQLDLPTVSGELRTTTTRALEPAATAVWLRRRPGS